nr:prepilin-type N-terminal cleavage/methylation domain-containing protein [uncultured Roseateles sp.]
MVAPSLARLGGRLEHRATITGLSRGFSLIELLVVVAMIAIAAATVSLSLRDPAAAQLEREAERLVALFETARAESRAAGLNVQWAPVELAGSADQFRFIGLPARIQLPRRWLGEVVNVEIANGRSVRLGPEPMIGAQQLRLRLGNQQLSLSTDGLAPFEITHSSNAP